MEVTIPQIHTLNLLHPFLHWEVKNNQKLSYISVILQIPEPEQTGDGPEKKITRLAIGVEGGFDPAAGKPQYTYTDNYNVVVLPGFHTYPWPNPSLPDVVNYNRH